MDTLTCLEKCIQGFTTVLTHLVHLIEQLDEAGKELGPSPDLQKFATQPPPVSGLDSNDGGAGEDLNMFT